MVTLFQNIEEYYYTIYADIAIIKFYNIQTWVRRETIFFFINGGPQIKYCPLGP